MGSSFDKKDRNILWYAYITNDYVTTKMRNSQIKPFDLLLHSSGSSLESEWQYKTSEDYLLACLFIYLFVWYFISIPLRSDVFSLLVWFDATFGYLHIKNQQGMSYMKHVLKWSNFKTYSGLDKGIQETRSPGQADCLSVSFFPSGTFNKQKKGGKILCLIGISKMKVFIW